MEYFGTMTSEVFRQKLEMKTRRENAGPKTSEVAVKKTKEQKPEKKEINMTSEVENQNTATQLCALGENRLPKSLRTEKAGN